jgi:putative DNA primase/helicase
VIIPAPERDEHFMDKLLAEKSGILNWLLVGCRDWQREGFGASEAVDAATQTYREESDPLAGFIDECCELGPGISAPTGALRARYERHCESQGVKPIDGNKFAARLEKLGCERDRKHSGRFWNGIGLTADVREYAGEMG